MFPKNKFLFIIAILCSCEFTSETNKTETYFERSDFKFSSELVGEVIELNTPGSPSNYYLIRDTIVAVQHFKADPYFVDFYGLNSKGKILSLAKAGRGPNEFLSAIVMYRSNDLDYFSIHDISGNSSTIYHFDSLLVDKESYEPSRVKGFPSVIKDYVLLNKDSMMGFNHYYFSSNGIENNAQPVIGLDLKNILNDDAYIQNSPYYSFNASGAYVLAQAKEENVVLAYHYEDKIEIFDKELKLIKKLNGPDGIKPAYKVKEDYSIATEPGKYHRSYYSAFVGKDAIYLFYVGFNGVSYDEPIGFPVEVFKISWSGELLHRYQLDRFLGYMTIDSSEEYLYGTDFGYANSHNDNPLLVRYKL